LAVNVVLSGDPEKLEKFFKLPESVPLLDPFFKVEKLWDGLR
jgi:hypothetical protein